jgi:Putative prokaryotic signal transducing protein
LQRKKFEPRHTAVPTDANTAKLQFMSDYVTIERADNEAVADLIRQRLDQAGIPCLLVPSGMAAVAGAGAAYAVTVPPDRAEEARELLGG